MARHRYRWLVRGMRSPWLERGVIAVGVLLCVPALWFGLLFDDVVHGEFALAHLNTDHAEGAWWDMFDLIGRGDRSVVPARIALGLMPWWTSPSLVFAFLRPLAVATHYLDYLWWPDRPLLMHLHNLVWYALVGAAAAAFYRRVLGAGLIAWLATALYAIDEAHAGAVAWVASRNTLMTAAFGLATLALWTRARAVDARRVPLTALAALSMLCAHGSSEAAFALWAYLLAYAWVLDGAGRRAGMLALWPLAAVSGGWLALSALGGYGMRGGGCYVDPRLEPVRFARVLPERLPSLLGEQFGLPHELVIALPDAWQRLQHAALLAALALAVTVGWPLLSKRPRAQFFALGTLGSALLACTALFEPRLLFMVGIGAHGLVAQLIVACARGLRAGVAMRSARGLVAALLLACHVPIALLYGPRTLASNAVLSERVIAIAKQLPQSSAAPGSAVIVLNAPNYVTTMFVTSYAVLRALPRRFVYTLGSSSDPVKLSRPSHGALRLEPIGGYLREPTSLVVRSPYERFVEGQTIVANGWRIVVERITDDGRPASVRVEPADIDAATLTWATWSESSQRFEPVVLPPVGGSFWLPGRGARNEQRGHR